ncbi:hypothetical protein D3C86_1658660 [compost metagenome]
MPFVVRQAADQAAVQLLLGYPRRQRLATLQVLADARRQRLARTPVAAVVADGHADAVAVDMEVAVTVMVGLAAIRRLAALLALTILARLRRVHLLRVLVLALGLGQQGRRPGQPDHPGEQHDGSARLEHTRDLSIKRHSLL